MKQQQHRTIADSIMHKKLFRIGLLLAASIALLGCSGVKQLGEVGNLKFYSVHSARFAGPNFTALAVQDTDSCEVRVQQIFGGPGIGSAIASTAIQSAGQIGGAAALGYSFPKHPVNDSVNVSGGNSTGGTSANSNGASASNQANGAGATAQSSSTAAGGAGSATGGTNQHIPPGLINNPGHTP